MNVIALDSILTAALVQLATEIVGGSPDVDWSRLGITVAYSATPKRFDDLRKGKVTAAALDVFRRKTTVEPDRGHVRFALSGKFLFVGVPIPVPADPHNWTRDRLEIAALRVVVGLLLGAKTKSERARARETARTVLEVPPAKPGGAK